MPDTIRKVFIYQDTKYKPIMVYFDRPYPAGIYIGHFDTMTLAETSIKEWVPKARTGIPKCDALVDFEVSYGQWDMDGLSILQKFEVEVKNCSERGGK